MKSKDLLVVAEGLYQKMTEEGYGQKTVGNARWIITYFNDYCIEHEITEVNREIEARFVQEHFGFDFYRTTAVLQCSIRHPLLMLLEFDESGTFAKRHPDGPRRQVPVIYEEIFNEYNAYLETLSMAPNTKWRRLHTFARYCIFLEANGITKIQDIDIAISHDFVNSLVEYAPKTFYSEKSMLRRALNWLHEKGYSRFPGTQIFPVIGKVPRNKLPSYFTPEEIEKILNGIDNSTASGKRTYCIVSLLVYLGIRAGDIINLKFSNIDWNNEIIQYSQQKTGKALSLPLLDSVKYPLIDYIKNARPESIDREYIFITFRSPHMRFQVSTRIYSIVKECMQNANIDVKDRHHGPHALRHSLATNLMSQNVPISTISHILGHSSSKVTENYLSVDEKHLKELSLEVPYV